MCATSPSLVTPKSSLPVPYKVNCRSGFVTKSCVTGTFPEACFQVSLKKIGGGCGAGPLLGPRSPGCCANAPIGAHKRNHATIFCFIGVPTRRHALYKRFILENSRYRRQSSK